MFNNLFTTASRTFKDIFSYMYMSCTKHIHINRNFGTNQPIVMHIDTDACAGTESEINYLEHVQAFTTVKSSYRGNVVIFITSPMNTT